jgi:hypothetical protein
MGVFKHARATLGRFALGATIVFSLVLGLVAISEPRGLSAASLGVVLLELAVLSAGYVLPQLAMNSRRRPRWDTAKSHIVFGLLGPITIAALSTQVQGVNLPGIGAIGFGTGVAIGLMQRLIASRWPRPPRPTLEEQATAIDAEMKRLDLLIENDSHVIPIDRPVKEPRRTPEQVA